MKIVAIHKYGTLTFRADGSAHIEGWALELSERRTPEPDELALMLYEHLAARTRDQILARAHINTETIRQ